VGESKELAANSCRGIPFNSRCGERLFSIGTAIFKVLCEFTLDYFRKDANSFTEIKQKQSAYQVLNKLQDTRDTPSTGFCYPLSLLTVLDYKEAVNLAQYCKLGTTPLNQFQYPKNNAILSDTLSYYYLLNTLWPVQQSYSVRALTGDPNKEKIGSTICSTEACLEKIVSEAKTSSPFVVSFANPSHAVAVTGYLGTQANGDHELSIYDSNYPNDPTKMVISKAYDSCRLANYPNLRDIKAFFDYSIFERFDIDGPKNDGAIQRSFSNATMDTVKITITTFDGEKSSKIEIINNASGKRVIYDPLAGTLTGDLQVFDYYNAPKGANVSDCQMVFEVPQSESYAFTGISGAELSIVGNGVYGSVSSDNATSATITSTGTITISGGNNMMYIAAIGVNNDDMDLVQVSGTTGGIVEVAATNAGAKIDGISSENTSVTVVSDFVERSAVNFTTDCDSVIVGKPNDVTVYGSTDGTTYTIDVLAGETIADLATAKNSRIASINAVVNGLQSADYTAASWQALQTAINNAIAQVNAATTIEAVNSIALPSTSGLVRVYSLTLNANGGSVSPTSWTGQQGNTYTLPTPTRSGYTFNGWSLSGGGSLNGSVYTFGSSNGTATAQWTQNKGIFGTNARWYGAWWHYILFFLGFGFIWMWF
jgi:uncharacterized repeat protein (TIGR02543 family)